MSGKWGGNLTIAEKQSMDGKILTHIYGKNISYMDVLGRGSLEFLLIDGFGLVTGNQASQHRKSIACCPRSFSSCFQTSLPPVTDPTKNTIFYWDVHGT